MAGFLVTRPPAGGTVTNMHSTRLRLVLPEEARAALRTQPASDEVASPELIDALLWRSARLLNDSLEAVRRLKNHTEDTDRQIEASRAFLADSYHTLDVLRRDRNGTQ
jgi:hypothetical protein